MAASNSFEDLANQLATVVQVQEVVTRVLKNKPSPVLLAKYKKILGAETKNLLLLEREIYLSQSDDENWESNYWESFELIGSVLKKLTLIEKEIDEKLEGASIDSRSDELKTVEEEIDDVLEVSSDDSDSVQDLTESSSTPSAAEAENDSINCELIPSSLFEEDVISSEVNCEELECLTKLVISHNKLISQNCFTLPLDNSRSIFDPGKGVVISHNCFGILILSLGFKSDLEITVSIISLFVNSADIHVDGKLFVKRADSRACKLGSDRTEFCLQLEQVFDRGKFLEAIERYPYCISKSSEFIFDMLASLLVSFNGSILILMDEYEGKCVIELGCDHGYLSDSTYSDRIAYLFAKGCVSSSVCLVFVKMLPLGISHHIAHMKYFQHCFYLTSRVIDRGKEFQTFNRYFYSVGDSEVYLSTVYCMNFHLGLVFLKSDNRRFVYELIHQHGYASYSLFNDSLVLVFVKKIQGNIITSHTCGHKLIYRGRTIEFVARCFAYDGNIFNLGITSCLFARNGWIFVASYYEKLAFEILAEFGYCLKLQEEYSNLWLLVKNGTSSDVQQLIDKGESHKLFNKFLDASLLHLTSIRIQWIQLDSFQAFNESVSVAEVWERQFSGPFRPLLLIYRNFDVLRLLDYLRWKLKLSTSCIYENLPIREEETKCPVSPAKGYYSWINIPASGVPTQHMHFPEVLILVVSQTPNMLWVGYLRWKFRLVQCGSWSMRSVRLAVHFSVVRCDENETFWSISFRRAEDHNQSVATLMRLPRWHLAASRYDSMGDSTSTGVCRRWWLDIYVDFTSNVYLATSWFLRPTILQETHASQYLTAICRSEQSCYLSTAIKIFARWIYDRGKLFASQGYFSLVSINSGITVFLMSNWMAEYGSENTYELNLEFGYHLIGFSNFYLLDANGDTRIVCELSDEVPMQNVSSTILLVWKRGNGPCYPCYGFFNLRSQHIKLIRFITSTVHFHGYVFISAQSLDCSCSYTVGVHSQIPVLLSVGYLKWIFQLFPTGVGFVQMGISLEGNARLLQLKSVLLMEANLLVLYIEIESHLFSYSFGNTINDRRYMLIVTEMQLRVSSSMYCDCHIWCFSWKAFVVRVVGLMKMLVVCMGGESITQELLKVSSKKVVYVSLQQNEAVLNCTLIGIHSYVDGSLSTSIFRSNLSLLIILKERYDPYSLQGGISGCRLCFADYMVMPLAIVGTSCNNYVSLQLKSENGTHKLEYLTTPKLKILE